MADTDSRTKYVIIVGENHYLRADLPAVARKYGSLANDPSSHASSEDIVTRIYSDWMTGVAKGSASPGVALARLTFTKYLLSYADITSGRWPSKLLALDVKRLAASHVRLMTELALGGWSVLHEVQLDRRVPDLAFTTLFMLSWAVPPLLEAIYTKFLPADHSLRVLMAQQRADKDTALKLANRLSAHYARLGMVELARFYDDMSTQVISASFFRRGKAAGALFARQLRLRESGWVPLVIDGLRSTDRVVIQDGYAHSEAFRDALLAAAARAAMPVRVFVVPPFDPDALEIITRRARALGPPKPRSRL